VARNGGDRISVPAGNTATASDLGLSRKEIHEARKIRDAEKAQPRVDSSGRCAWRNIGARIILAGLNTPGLNGD
jgi:hypothetical protein